MAKLESENVVIEAPFSFVGSYKRIWKLSRVSEKILLKQPSYKIATGDEIVDTALNCVVVFLWVCLVLPMLIVAKMLIYGMVLALILMAWCGVFCWYIFIYGIFGILFIPYRLVRRSSRKQKRDALRHRELISAINGNK